MAMLNADAVCSWSLRPSSPGDLAELVRASGCSAVQLALEPIRCRAWSMDETADALRGAGIGIVSGMMETKDEDYSTIETIKRSGGIRPGETWAANLERAGECAQIAESLGLSLVTLHAGFIPEDHADPEHAAIVERLRALVDVFASSGVRLGLETGQESAEALLATLDTVGRESLGVNFDPANMLLYGTGDPCEAFDRLADRVVQVHLKDAVRSASAGEWGAEVVIGTGGVDWDRFLDLIASRTRGVDLVIEREAGDTRVDDVRAGRAFIAAKVASGCVGDGVVYGGSEA